MRSALHVFSREIAYDVLPEHLRIQILARPHCRQIVS
jgi:hypothetical protein